VTVGDSGPNAPVWPQPHPSPPHPPPRAYGSPGTPRNRPPWAWVVVAVVVVTLVAAFGVVLLVRSLADEGGGSRAADDPVTTPAGQSAGSPTASASTPPAPVQCWDGSGAQAVEDCPMPRGAAGLAWVFPALSTQRCGSPSSAGNGAVIRILCTDRLADGSRVQLGYYQWDSVDKGLAFYEDQDLDRRDGDGFHRFTGASGHTLKSAALYADAPYSLTVTVPSTAVIGPDDDYVFAARPPGQLRGEPVG
jgi:hypothetical protein